MNTWRDGLLSVAVARANETAPFAYLAPLVDHMAEQRAVFRSVIGRRGSGPVEHEFRTQVLKLLQATPPPASQHQDWELTARFIAGGWVDLMKWWVDAPSPIASDALVARMCHLAHSAIEMHTARLA